MASSYAKDTVLLLNDSFPDTSKVFIERLKNSIPSDDFDVKVVDPAGLVSCLDNVAGNGSILVLPNSRYFPADAISNLDEFLKRGNNLFAVSGPMLSKPVIKEDGLWVDAVSGIKPLILESICPPYKTYTTNAAYVNIVGDKKQYSIQKSVCIALPRSRGYLCDSLHKWRQIPFAYALDANGKNRGVAGELFLNNSGEYSRSIWGYLGIEQSDIENALDVYIPAIVTQLKRMKNGVFIANAGSDAFGYAAGEKTRLGAYVANLSRNPADVCADFQVYSNKRVMFSSSTTAQVSSGSDDAVAFISGKSIKLPAGEYIAKTTLRIGGSVVDETSQSFNVINYGKLPDAEIVKTKNGDFHLDGKVWHSLGVGYFPYYVSGLEPNDYWEQYWSNYFYDPDVIEHDLALMNDLGINTISIQYNLLDQARPVMDLLARAHRHGIKVHLYMPGLHPLKQDLKLAAGMIKAAHLSQSPAMFAYDLGWEVCVGVFNERKKYDGLWQQWIIDQYGSVDIAQRDWNYVPEKQDGVVICPSDYQLTNNGVWNTYVAAYRRFWDDEISKQYAKVRRFVKSLDPNHLAGARSGYGGTGALCVAGMLPFDLASGAKHLDFISPEAYNLSGGRIDFLKSGMTDAYGRLVSGGKPVYWAEFGIPLFLNVKPGAYRSEMSMLNMDRQYDYVNNMVSAVREVGSNGCAVWWWAGGYRCDEKSDFGIVAPDGSPRPAAHEIANAWKKSALIGNRSKPEVIFTIDRDLYASGYAGMYDAYSAQFADSLANGRGAGLRTAGTKTTSSDAPLTLVGNVPYEGHGPLKYLNAEFNRLKINSKLVNSGDSVEIKPGDPIIISASVGNTGEATWLAKGVNQTGGVCLLASFGDKRTTCAIKSDAKYLSDAIVPKFKVGQMTSAPESLIIRMACTNRAEFGEIIRIRLLPERH
ncbi:MAG: hypothetical protein ABFD54_10785 [Armatimonadota bacterium]|nr:hypothetical protein [bacterium]